MSLLKKNLNQAIITLGGKGTRLELITKGIPKPLYPINGISTLERAIIILTSQGIKEFIFFINFKPELFEINVKKLIKQFNIKIKLIFEDYPKGEAGSLFECLESLEDTFLFINGDIVFDLDILKFNNYHLLKQSDITIITHLTNHPDDSDCIIESPSLSIAEYKLKNIYNQNKSFFLGNAGMAIVSKKVLISLKKEIKSFPEQVSLFRDIVINALKINFNVFSYNTSEYLKDMGTPKRFKSVESDLKNNIVSNRSYRKKQKVLFLDRDDTLIKCPSKKYILEKNNISFFEDRIKKISQISDNFDFCLIITNQPQISMGLTTWQKVIEINGFVINKCQQLGLNIAGFYLCPHHPHSGFLNEVSNLKVNCFCRKPSPGLFIEAAYMRNIELKESLLIGDSERDFYASKNTGIDFLSVTDL
tara:strand:- start:12927 stop:14183 length:1257 start_codon:yes stop_codon:yes gene_type:complete